MKFLMAVLILGASSIGFAQEIENAHFFGRDKDTGAECALSVIRFEIQGKVPSFQLIGQAQGIFVAVNSLRGDDLDAAFRGERNTVTATGGSNLDASGGKQKVSIQFQNGHPISAAFKNSYVFVNRKSSECIGLVRGRE